MKIGILTWHKAVNHGAILQTYALQKTLEKMNCSVVELDYKFSENGNCMKHSSKIKKVIKKLNINGLTSKFKLNSWLREKKLKFKEFTFQELNIGSMYNKEKNLDKVIIGSDMVFDFYEGYNSYMYGKDVNCDYIFSYAACFGYTTPEIFESYDKKDEIIECLNKLKGIAYRDDNTGRILKKHCKLNNCVKTIDPVLLYGFNEEKNKWNKFGWSNKKYILIYSYTYNMDSKLEIKAIKSFAKKNKLEVISVGYYHGWCDKCINADPKEFIELFSNAKYIITDTFHGTVFSIIFNKKFLAIVRNNSFKILDLLNELNLLDTICKDIKRDIRKLSNDIDYNTVNQKLEKLREKSFGYIINNISNC